MGRIVKRVPLDFNWTQDKIWYGYAINTCLCDEPYDFTCDECRNFAELKGIEIKSFGCPKFDFKEPPVGEGWQMWETTSEGSPMSPVFKTPEELAKWLAETKASSFGSDTATFEQWYKMITGTGWAPSAVMENNKLVSGVESVAENN